MNIAGRAPTGGRARRDRAHVAPIPWIRPLGAIHPPARRQSRLYQGWRIVGVSALAQAVSVGSTFYAYGVFVKPLVAEFGASRLAVTLGLTLMTIAQGLIAPILGHALDRLSPRAIFIAGVVLQSAGLGLLSQTTAFWQVGVLFVTAIGVGSYLFSPLATSTLVARWFIRRRGQALGITSLGAAAGGVAFPPLATALIDAFGWRGAAGALGAGMLLLIVPFALFVKRRPSWLIKTCLATRTGKLTPLK
jgi:MFS family permease